MKLFRNLSLSLLCFIAVSFTTTAQQVVPPSPAVIQTDPIVEMLDSLVMLNSVIRGSNLNTFGSGETSKNNIPRYSDDIYAQRMAKIYSPIPLTYNEEVKNYIELYAYKKRELTSRVMGLSNLYFPLFEEILDKEGLPLEFKYLSIVESALNPLAVSHMGATGLWQFMFNTGKLYDLKVTSFYDERKDPVKSTYAACRYFKDMYKIYGDWLLVIASYNCGPGNVNKAIRRSGGKTNFWEIARYLPAETRGYVPAFIAVTYLLNHTTEHNLFPVAPAFNYFEVDTVAVERGVSFNRISQAIDVPVEVIAFLNPLYKRGVIPDTEHPNFLRLPSGKISAYIAAEPNLFEPEVALPVFASLNSTSDDSGEYTYSYKKVKKNYTVRGGDNLSQISEKLNCSVTELKKWNRLKSTRLMKGQKLAYYANVKVKTPVPQKETIAVNNVKSNADTASLQANTDTAAATNAQATNVVPETNRKFIYHMVQKGDTLWNIAQRYDGVTVEQIKEINRISDITNLKPGTKLKVLVNG
jgi:membrane-bound lytic murein transglycosylase D